MQRREGGVRSLVRALCPVPHMCSILGQGARGRPSRLGCQLPDTYHLSFVFSYPMTMGLALASSPQSGVSGTARHRMADPAPALAPRPSLYFLMARAPALSPEQSVPPLPVMAHAPLPPPAPPAPPPLPSRLCHHPYRPLRPPRSLPSTAPRIGRAPVLRALWQG
jgi:hypothetical protein